MKVPQCSARRRAATTWVPVLAGAIFLLGGRPVPAEDTVTVVRVEEDWKLVLATPDPNSAGPQITCVWSPTGDVSSTHAVFEINHQSVPQFYPGGLHLQVWNGGTPQATSSFPKRDLLQQAGETVCWTQCVALSNGILTFEVLNGTSTAWGTFGGSSHLRAQASTSLVNLNGYNPSVSVNNSGVGYAANRVASLVLKRVRLFTEADEVLEFDTPTTVYPRN